MLSALDLTPGTFLTQARFDPLAFAFVALTTAWYLSGVRTLRAAGRPWPSYRVASFAYAQVAVVAVCFSGLAAHDSSEFPIRAVQYLVLATVVAPLLVFAAPVTLLTETGPQSVQDRALAAVRGRPGRILFHPVVAWSLYGATIAVLFFTDLYAVSRHDYLLREASFATLVVTGFVFVYPAANVDPQPRRLGYGLRIAYFAAGMPYFTIVGMALESQTRSLISGVSLTDLQTGGGLIWAAGEGLVLLGALAAFVGWLRTEERSMAHHDEMTEAAAERQLAHWRAARDAAARAAGG